MRLRVTYTRRDDLRRDLEAQLSRGGIFVTVAPPDGLQYGQRIPLEIVAPDGTVARSDGEVLASIPEQGVALAVPPEAVAKLREVLARLTFDPPDAGPVKHQQIGGTSASTVPVSAAPSAPEAPEAPGVTARSPVTNPLQQWDSLTSADKIRLAQHGERDERAAVLRDKNRALHPHVLKNTRITLDEVVAIARNAQMAGEMLKLIADKGDWSSRPQVAEALARNPKTPNDVGVRMLANCSSEALRQMAKGAGAPPHIIQAARKRVVG